MQSPPTPTDVLLLAVENAIEQHRPSLDHMRGLVQITVVVNYDQKRERPGRVTVKPEMVTASNGERE